MTTYPNSKYNQWSTANNYNTWITNSTSTSIDSWNNTAYWSDQYSGNQPRRREAPPLAFNKYINASDMLEEFIKFLGTHNVRQGEVMGLPMDLFIKWLIIRAAEADNEPTDVVFQLPAPKDQPRCLGCQKYIKNGTPAQMHGPKCAEWYFARQQKVAVLA
jgi:hypothetical protein